MDDPKTLAQWKQYFSSLQGEELWSKAVAANSYAFVKRLQQEGYSPDDIEAILTLLAKRFVDLKELPPAEGYVDLGKLAWTAFTSN